MSQLNQALITLGRKMLIWCQHSDLIWTLSSCGTRIHQVSHAKMRCHVQFTRFLFSGTKALKLDSDHCILDYVLTFAPVVLVCLFFNTLQEIRSFFTTKQEETLFFFLIFKFSEKLLRTSGMVSTTSVNGKSEKQYCVLSTPHFSCLGFSWCVWGTGEC